MAWEYDDRRATAGPASASWGREAVGAGGREEGLLPASRTSTLSSSAKRAVSKSSSVSEDVVAGGDEDVHVSACHQPGISEDDLAMRVLTSSWLSPRVSPLVSRIARLVAQACEAGVSLSHTSLCTQHLPSLPFARTHARAGVYRGCYGSMSCWFCPISWFWGSSRRGKPSTTPLTRATLSHPFALLLTQASILSSISTALCFCLLLMAPLPLRGAV